MNALTDDTRVDPVNAEQAAAWDGGEGRYWAENADLYERALERYDDAMFAAAGIDQTSHVLDIGCGTGSTSRAAAALAPRGSVLGVDLSSEMVAEARRRAAAAGLTNAAFAQGDAQILGFGAVHDVAISRTAVMFFGDPVAGLTNVRTALRPGGRLVALVWQSPAQNEWFLKIMTSLAAGRELPGPPPDAPGPFALADPGRVRDVVSAAGFADVSVDPVSRPMRFGRDADEAQHFILGQMGWVLEGLDADRRRHAENDLRRSVERHETAAGVQFDSAAWLITATG